MRATLRSEVLERLGNVASLNPPSSSLGLEAWVPRPFRTWAVTGVGRIGIVDGDVVELTNMRRQVLHTGLGRNKAESAAGRLHELNPEVAVDIYPEMLTPDRARKLFARYDLVLDCTDTFLLSS